MGIDTLLERIRERQADAATAVPELLTGGPEPLYHHHNPALAIDFQVQRLPLAGLQVLDPRLVRIAPGARNESHRHAHESIFVVLAGEGELRIGAETVPLKAGDVACVPRWLVHQSRNSSTSEELQLLAITDFGLTSGVLGGADALVSAEEAVDALTATALNHRAVRHPYLAALADGTLPAHRQALLGNLMEESGQYDTAELETLAGLGIAAEWIEGVPHPQLFERFRLAVAGAGGDDAKEEPEVVSWREMLLAVLSQGSASEAVGALGLGTEAIVSTLYQAFGTAIERSDTLDPRDTVFFPLHTAVDDAHQASLRQIAIDCAASERGLRRRP